MKRRMIVLLCVTPFLLAASALLAYNFHILLSGEQAFTYRPDIILAAVRENEKVRLLSLLFAAGMLLLLCAVLLSPSTVMHSDNTTVKILPNVRIPAASGHGEYGTAWFMSEKTLRRCFAHQRLDKKMLKELTKEANANETDTKRPVSRMG